MEPCDEVTTDKDKELHALLAARHGVVTDRQFYDFHKRQEVWLQRVIPIGADSHATTTIQFKSIGRIEPQALRGWTRVYGFCRSGYKSVYVTESAAEVARRAQSAWGEGPAKPQPPDGAITNEDIEREAMLTRSHTVVIDIDGVIADATDFERGAPTWEEKFEQAALLPGAVEALAELTAAGWFVVLYTARFKQHRNLTIEWLKKHGIDWLTHYQELHCEKPCGILYVDDRGHRFDGWPGVLKALEAADD